MMLWTAPPPARRCQGRRGVTRFGGLGHASCDDDWSRHRKVGFSGPWRRRRRQCVGATAPAPRSWPRSCGCAPRGRQHRAILSCNDLIHQFRRVGEHSAGLRQPAAVHHRELFLRRAGTAPLRRRGFRERRPLTRLTFRGTGPLL